MTDSVPEKLGKYKIIEEVGRGGFAAVYKAVDTTLDRTVALKVLAPHLLWDPTFVQRFQQEAKVAANLDHRNIVTIHEVGQIEGVYFIAMQFLEGRTLSQILEAEGPLPVSQVQAIIEQLASALDYAHARGFVHRDIKSSNVIVADDGRATLTDFGLVKAGEGTKLSTTGVVFGTPEYMSPEQAEGMEELDARSDIYSLGVVVYEMFTGKVPFSGTTPLSVMRGHADKPPPSPSEINPDVSPAVEAVLLRTLAKKREERYQSAGEMAQALREATGARVEATPVPLEPEIPVPTPVVKKPVEEKVVPPLVEPAAVEKEEARPPTAPSAPKAVPKRALGGGALLAGGLVLLAIVGIIIFAILGGLSVPAPERPVEQPPGEGPLGEVQITFTADRTHLRPGECATLEWSVEGAFEVALNGEPVEHSGHRVVCLEETTSFWLEVDTGETWERREVVISVEGAGEPPPLDELPPEEPPADELPPEEPPPQGSP